MKRIVVTGASGFIGQHVLPLLVKKGFEVHAVAYPSPLDISGCKWHIVDLMDRDKVRILMEEVRPTHLLHLAWYAEPGKYWASVENFRWVYATIQLVDAFQSVGGKHVVGAGTCAEYDWSGSGILTENSTPLVPATVYGMSKNAVRQILEAYALAYGFRIAWGRVFYLYGPYEHSSRLIPYVINSLLQGKEAKCTHGHQMRDFLYVEDVASAFVAILESDILGTVNIASGKSVSIREITATIANIVGTKSLLRLGAVPTRAGEPKILEGDNQKLLSIGWTPAYGLRDGIKRTVDWWRVESNK
jgi:nucleoside-diphosphate-sugar epimerase